MNKVAVATELVKIADKLIQGAEGEGLSMTPKPSAAYKKALALLPKAAELAKAGAPVQLKQDAEGMLYLEVWFPKGNKGGDLGMPWTMLDAKQRQQLENQDEDADAYDEELKEQFIEAAKQVGIKWSPHSRW